MTFSGPSAAYNPNYSRYYFCYCFRRRRPSPSINLAAIAYGPSYCGIARSWPYYYRLPYYRAARYQSYGRYLQLLRGPILD